VPLPDSSTIRVKICGLTDPAEARRVVELGADWVGLNFHPASSRFVSLGRAAEIVAALPNPNAAVALFVDRPVAEILETVDALGIGIVQLHGDEPWDVVRALRDRGLIVVRAFRIGSRVDVASMQSWMNDAVLKNAVPDAVLFDAKADGSLGGTGAMIPDDLIEQVTKWSADRLHDELGRALKPLWILAGGLNPGNVVAAVARWRPWMVDVASGVEGAPGRKDLSLVAAFLEQAIATKDDA
jgi:phosphoribosylanthranilate isomerase